jgi:hypothetical protein
MNDMPLDIKSYAAPALTVAYVWSKKIRYANFVEQGRILKYETLYLLINLAPSYPHALISQTIIP